MTKEEEQAVSIVNKDTLVAAGMALLLLLCLAGALWTAYWSLRIGLTPRPPLSAFQTLVRFLVVMLALLLWRLRGDLTERSALVCTVNCGRFIRSVRSWPEFDSTPSCAAAVPLSCLHARRGRDYPVVSFEEGGGRPNANHFRARSVK
jgi:hypothetical protein